MLHAFDRSQNQSEKLCQTPTGCLVSTDSPEVRHVSDSISVQHQLVKGQTHTHPIIQKVLIGRKDGRSPIGQLFMHAVAMRTNHSCGNLLDDVVYDIESTAFRRLWLSSLSSRISEVSASASLQSQEIGHPSSKTLSRPNQQHDL